MKTVYLITGVSGAGKSWVLEHVNVNAPKIKSDLYPNIQSVIAEIESSSEEIFLVEKTTLISSFIKSMKQHYHIVLLIVAGDFLQVKDQLIKRGGTVTPALYRRWKRMHVLQTQYDAIMDSSDAIKRWLEHNIKKNLVYQATMPNGKMYVGQTSKTLEKRKMEHIYTATSRQHRNQHNVLFHKALLKHGAAVQWSILADKLSNAEANRLEQKYINEFQCLTLGYNQTSGGKQNYVHSPITKQIIAQKAALHSQIHWNDERRIKASNTMTQQWQDPALAAKRTVGIKKSRSSKEQRAMSSTDSVRRYSDNTKRLEMAISCGAKEFAVYKDDKLVGKWVNAAQCAKDLGFATKTHISNCLHGRRQTYHGYTFIYISESNNPTEEFDQ